MNPTPFNIFCLNEGCPVHWKGRIAGVCCPMRVDEETVAR